MPTFRILGAVALLICLGCSSEPNGPKTLDSNGSGRTDSNHVAVDPEQAAFEQIHEGTTQLDGAADSIEESLRSAEALKPVAKGAIKSALEEILGLIDSAGAGIADFTLDPPTLEEFRKDFSHFDDRRLKAIDSANDAHHEILEALGLADALGQDQSVPKYEAYGQLADLLDVAATDLADAIIALGGKVEDSN